MTHPNSLKNLKPWVKGQQGHTHQGSKLPEHLRAIKSLSHAEVVKLISRYARMNLDEIGICAKDPKLPMIEACFVSIFQKSRIAGDYTRIAFLLDRSIGKVRDAVDDDESDDARAELGQLSMKELLHLVKDKLPEEPK